MDTKRCCLNDVSHRDLLKLECDLQSQCQQLVIWWRELDILTAAPIRNCPNLFPELEAYRDSLSDAIKRRKALADAIRELPRTHFGNCRLESADIEDLAITTAKLASQAVTTAKIADLNVTAEKLAANAVETAKILDEAVTLDKMADLARGSIITGQGAGNRPTALDANDSGKILVGDGTDLNSVAVSGDATLAANGALTIANDAVSLAKMANITRGSIIVGGASNEPTLLDANDSGKILVGDGTDLLSVAVSGDITLAANGAATIGAEKVGTDNMTTNGKAFVLPLLVSLETGFLNVNVPLYAAVSWNVTAWKIFVLKQVAATDDATILLKNAAGATVSTQVIPAGTVVETVYDNAVSFTLAAGNALKVHASKTTAGGELLVLIHGILNGDG